MSCSPALLKPGQGVFTLLDRGVPIALPLVGA
jgi:hypothetical protein